MEISSSILHLLTLYQLPAIFLGAFFFGETVIISAAVLAARGYWSVSTVFFLSLVGTVLSDCIWFFCGTYFLKFTHRWVPYREKYKSFIEKLEKKSLRHSFLILLFFKFLYGTRIITIIYLSLRKMRFLTFFIFDTIGSFLWLLFMVSIGWFAGKGIINLMPWLDRAEYTLLILVAVIVIFKLGTIWINKKIAKP